jgi:Ecdysteroid kinase-like family
LGEHDGRSGGSLERVVLAGGERLVVKRTAIATDLTRRLTDDTTGREYAMWRAGLLDRLPAGVGHAVLDGWRDGDDTVVVMRDLGDAVYGWDDVLTTADVDRVLTAAVALHGADIEPPPGVLATLGQRTGMLAPDRMRPLTGAYPLAGAVLAGWDHFADLVRGEVAVAVRALLDDPAPLADALARRPCTLIHGDLWPVNMAAPDDTVVLLDWNLAAWAPPALDIAYLLAGAGAANIAVSREAVLDTYRSLCGPAHDEEAMALALLTGLLDFGWNKALDAVTAADPGQRERHRADLDWWVRNAAAALRSL